MAKKRDKKKKIQTNTRSKELTALLNEARNGSPMAQTVLAYEYMRGGKVKANPEKAFELFSKAAMQMYPDAMYGLGMAYMTGVGTEANDEEAKRWLERADKAGHKEARDRLTDLEYLHNQTIAEKKEFEDYNKKYEEGDLSAASVIGEYYITGYGCKKDIDKGITILKDAINKGSSDAAYSLGYGYQSGEAGEINLDEAIKYYEIAAKDKNSSALHNLGSIAINEHKDLEKGFEYLKEAAALNNPLSNYQLAAYYFGYSEEVDMNIKEAKKYLNRAIELKYTDALELLDRIHQDKLIVGDELIELSLKAAELSGANSDLTRLAFDYLDNNQIDKGIEYLDKAANNGDDTARRFSTSLKINKKDPEKGMVSAAEAGDDIDALNLASCYFSGLIVKEDTEKAIHWLKVAINKGNVSAKGILGELYMTGTNVETDYKSGLALLEEGAKANDLRSISVLEACYREGMGVKKNLRKAAELSEQYESLTR